jgi:hypothetical protein
MCRECQHIWPPLSPDLTPSFLIRVSHTRDETLRCLMYGAAALRISYKVYGKVYPLLYNDLAFAKPVRSLLIASDISCNGPHRQRMLSPYLRYS